MPKITKEEFKKMAEKKTPNSRVWFNTFKAFVIGGLICIIGQAINDIYISLKASTETAALLTSMTLIFLGALLTGLNIYDDIGRFAGAGSIVPITGFANSIVAPAMEFKSEGYIMGVGAKMFVISGPVIVYGVVSSVLVGIIYYFIK